MFVLEKHDEAGILPARDRRLSNGGNFVGRSAEFAGNLVHGHAAGRRGDVGLFDRNAVVDGDGLSSREAAREHRGQQQNSIPHGVPPMLPIFYDYFGPLETIPMPLLPTT